MMLIKKGQEQKGGKAILLRVAFQGGPMLAIIICIVVMGIILGSNFTVFILGPAILLTTAVTLVTGFANADYRFVVFTTLAMLASLQIGYFVGGISAAYLSTTPWRTWKSWRHF
jgi:hypothetical protein